VIRRTAALGALAGLALTTGVQLGIAASTGAAAGVPVRSPSDRSAAALARLRADAAEPVRVTRGVDGLARVVGVSGVRNPGVTTSTRVRAAALAHLERYGALVGADEPGTDLVPRTVTHAVTGDDVVRFTQRRDGLPVIGGAVAVGLRPDRQLGSLTASVSRATVPGAAYSAEAAGHVALADVQRRFSDRRLNLTAGTPVHELWDPAVLGVRRTADPATHARGVWTVDVQAGPTLHRLVLVDDRTGAVVQDLDVLQPVNRVVCDNHNFMVFPDVACTSDFARTENGPRSKVRDVNDAFELAGVVSRF
jgi:hypothetical protein